MFLYLFMNVLHICMTWDILNVITILEESILRYITEESNYNINKLYTNFYDIYVFVFILYK